MVYCHRIFETGGSRLVNYAGQVCLNGTDLKEYLRRNMKPILNTPHINQTACVYSISLVIRMLLRVIVLESKINCNDEKVNQRT